MAVNYQYYSDKKFAKKFIEDLMIEVTDYFNNEGVTDQQGLWIYHRFRKVNINGLDLSIADLIAPFVDVGAIYYVFANMSPDDMTETYHFLTQARLDYIRNKIGVFLGLEEPL